MLTPMKLTQATFNLTGSSPESNLRQLEQLKQEDGGTAAICIPMVVTKYGAWHANGSSKGRCRYFVVHYTRIGFAQQCHNPLPAGIRKGKVGRAGSSLDACQPLCSLPLLLCCIGVPSPQPRGPQQLCVGRAAGSLHCFHFRSERLPHPPPADCQDLPPSDFLPPC